MDNPAPITRIVPHPRPVALGMETYLASEFRLADVAALQAWIEAEADDPFERIAPRVALGPQDREWKLILWGALDEIEAYPPRVGSADGDGLLFSPDGLAHQLWLSLRREQPGFTLGDAARLLDDATADQWAKFSRVAWGQTSRGTIRGVIERAAGIGAHSAGGPANWSALWCSYVANVGPGAPPFESLTLTQLRTWLAEGDPDDKAAVVEGAGEMGGMAAIEYARKIGAFWGDIGDEPAPSGDPAPAPADPPAPGPAAPPPEAVRFPWDEDPV